LQQRLSLHFKKRLLASELHPTMPSQPTETFYPVQSQLDMVTANNPNTSSKVSSAIAFSDHAWRTVEGIVTVISIAAGALGQASVLSKVFGLHWDVPLFLVMCVAQPLLSSLKLRAYIGMQGGWDCSCHSSYLRSFVSECYTMVTNQSWLRMKAFFELGTNNSYKKEVLGSNLAQYINSGTVLALIFVDCFADATFL
jgi:hypothetical protein